MKKFFISFLFITACLTCLAFAGCGKTPSGGDNTGDGGNLTPSDSVTVTFIVDGEVKETQTVKIGANFTIPAFSTDKQGYTFEGWQRANGKFVNLNLLSETVVTENTVLTAVYSVNSYRTEFYYMDTLVGTPQKTEYGKQFTLPNDGDVIDPSVGKVKGYKPRGVSGAIILKPDMDLTVKGNAKFDVITELNPYSSIDLIDFNAEFYLHDKYFAGDDAKVKITFADGNEYFLKENEYEIIAPEDFGSEEKEYEITIMIKIADDMEKHLTATVTKNKDKFSVLFIGNSYSDDTIDLSYNVAKSAGFKTIEIATLYYPGCTIDEHLDFIKQNKAAYVYRYFKEDGTLSVSTDIGWGNENLIPADAKYTAKKAIIEKPWDYIILQQGSRDSGHPASYKNIGALIDYVLANATDKNVKLAFNMTWAYRQGSSNGGFAGYNNDQQTMYDGIIESVKTQILPNKNFVAIIPNGTAVQNARTSFVGDRLTRDDADHLTKDFGRYIAAMNFVCTISGVSVDDITYAPANLTKDYIAVAKESVKNSIANPYEVTPSRYKAAGSEVLDGKTELTGLEFKSGYYYSDNATQWYEPFTASDAFTQSFFYTKKFTKSELPVGSVIYVASGWQYRPEGWINRAKNASGTRPENTTATYVVVTEEWWGNFTERAFNISKANNPGTSIASEAAKISTIFKIYVPAK